MENPGAREAWLWIAALLCLVAWPGTSGGHTLCVFRHLGTWCPGCGLGRAMQAALHGQLPASLTTHPLGGVTIVVLVRRIAATFLG